MSVQWATGVENMDCVFLYPRLEEEEVVGVADESIGWEGAEVGGSVGHRERQHGMCVLVPCAGKTRVGSVGDESAGRDEAEFSSAVDHHG